MTNAVIKMQVSKQWTEHQQEYDVLSVLFSNGVLSRLQSFGRVILAKGERRELKEIKDEEERRRKYEEEERKRQEEVR